MNKRYILKNSKVKYIIAILLIQSFFTLAIILSSYLNLINSCNPEFFFTLLFFAIILSFLAIIFIKELYELAKSKMQLNNKSIKLEENRVLVKKLRSKKHDFSNHLQTIYGMLQLHKYRKAEEYVKSLSKDIHNMDNMKLAKDGSIFDSILNYKIAIAKGRGLDLSYDFEAGFADINLNLKNLFKILTNLVDNAIEAAESHDGEEAEIIVKGINKTDRYILSVYNQGSYISDEKKRLIFTAGFSSKENKGEDRGFGLHIIKSLIEEVNGEIEVISEKDYGTEFICHLPK